MTTSINSFSTSSLLSFLGLSGYRALIATPLEGIAKREILAPQFITTLKVLRATSIVELWRGLQPNSFKFLTRTPVQILSLKFASWIVPSKLDPAVRGAVIGLASSGMEASFNNIWNVFITRFIQGQGWSVITQEGPFLVSKGLSPALIHRSLSGIIFWTTYEKLRQINPNHPALTGICAGIIQVNLTAPFYIATTLRQGKNPPLETLWVLFMKIVKNRGWFKGLFLPGLIPRLGLSILTSGPLMSIIEKFHIIHR